MPLSVEVTSSSHGLGTQVLVCGILASKELTVTNYQSPSKQCASCLFETRNVGFWALATAAPRLLRQYNSRKAGGGAANY